MRYRDIWINNPSFFKRCTASYKCLAWSANYEHAVFDLDDAIHPAAVLCMDKTAWHAVYPLL